MRLMRAQVRERNVYGWAATRRRTTPTLPTDLQRRGEAPRLALSQFMACLAQATSEGPDKLCTIRDLASGAGRGGGDIQREGQDRAVSIKAR